MTSKINWIEVAKSIQEEYAALSQDERDDLPCYCGLNELDHFPFTVFDDGHVELGNHSFGTWASGSPTDPQQLAEAMEATYDVAMEALKEQSEGE